MDGSHVPPARFVGAILTAVRCLDPRQVSATLDDAASLLGTGVTVDEIVMPSLRVVNMFCSSGTMETTHGDLFVAATNRWVVAESARRRTSRRSGSIMVAAGPDDLSSIALDCLELLLTEQGVRVINLGAQTPATHLTLAAQNLRPNAVVVISNTPTLATNAVRSVTAVSEIGYPVYYAGTSFASQFTQQTTPGELLYEPLADAAQQLIARHTDRPPDERPASGSRTNVGLGAPAA